MIANRGNRFQRIRHARHATHFHDTTGSPIVRENAVAFREDNMRFNSTTFGRVASVITLTTLATLPASAQGLITKKRLSASLAMEAVMEAVEVCKKAGYAVTAIIVDNEGVRQAVLRGDGAVVHTLDSAYVKAYTAASLAPVRKDGSTKALSERIARTPGVSTAGLASLPNVNFTPGGVTIMAGDEAIGGIGVGGAPGGNFDHDCAVAALDKIKDRMK
jgi:uncharacterized protein GlcG (DUF336 family)